VISVSRDVQPRELFCVRFYDDEVDLSDLSEYRNASGED